MMIKLVFNCTSFDKYFYNIDTKVQNKKEYIEKLLIKKINAFNKKLNVQEVLYELLSLQFPYYKKDGRNGAIVEDIEIQETEKNYYTQKGYYVFNKDSQTYARHILEYVFLTPQKEASRNIFISQTIFPAVIDYISDYLQSPNYTFANHKIMLINTVNKGITANSIKQECASFIAIGMDYVVLFDVPYIETKDVSKDLKSFIKQYDKYSDLYENQYYKIDFLRKSFKIKTDDVRKNITDNDFNGSHEKFYWVKVLPMALLAYNSNFKVDYSEYKQFCEEYSTIFSVKSKKFQRCKIILNYFEKYFK